MRLIFWGGIEGSFSNKMQDITLNRFVLIRLSHLMFSEGQCRILNFSSITNSRMKMVRSKKTWLLFKTKIDDLQIVKVNCLGKILIVTRIYNNTNHPTENMKLACGSMWETQSINGLRHRLFRYDLIKYSFTTMVGASVGMSGSTVILLE